MTRIVTGLFDTRGDAERTIEHLIQQLGLDPNGVEAHAAEGEEAERAAAARLEAMALPRRDLAAYQEAVRRGGIVVTARAEEEMLDRVMDVFEEYNAVDLDAREEEWRGTGWTGYTPHDEDIGFATYGQDAVIARVPQQHHDDAPAGALGRMEIVAGDDKARATRYRIRPRVRSFVRDTAG